MRQTFTRPFSYYIGNLLILSSLLGFFFTFLPFLLLLLFPPQLLAHLPNKGFFITIPKINAQSPIIEQVDPWNESVYTEALHHGVAQGKGSPYPGMSGSIYLFAHSSGLPWEETRFNTVFFRLGELKKGDNIILTKDGKDFLYKVRETKEVWPTDVQEIISAKKTQVIVQTCTPIGTSLKRLLVFADPSGTSEQK